MRLPAMLLALAFALTARADSAADLALIAGDATLDAARVATALADEDPLVRATAARVITVCGLTAALPAVHKALEKEKDPDAAREQVRALALLGSDEEVAFAASRLAAYPSSIDIDFARAVARRGAPHATALYLLHRERLRGVALPVPYALWGRSPLAAATGSRLIAVSDAASLAALFRTMLDSKVDLDGGIVTAALTSDAAPVRIQALWYVLGRYGDDPAAMPERIAAAAAAAAVKEAGAEESFVREVIHRLQGAEPAKKGVWMAWLATSEGRAAVPQTSVLRRYLSPEEQTAVWGRVPTKDFGETREDAFFAQGFELPLLLPAGLGAKIISAADCREGWVGVASVGVDRTGRVTTADLKDVHTTDACRTALGAMLRLSFAEPSSILAPMTSNQLQLVDGGVEPCVDEAPVSEARKHAVGTAPQFTPPAIVRRVEPVLPEEVKATLTGDARVVAVATVSRTGCVRGVRIVTQSPSGELNSAAVLALSKWNFKPATLDGIPVDATLTITFHFKERS